LVHYSKIHEIVSDNKKKKKKNNRSKKKTSLNLKIFGDRSLCLV